MQNQYTVLWQTGPRHALPIFAYDMRGREDEDEDELCKSSSWSGMFSGRQRPNHVGVQALERPYPATFRSAA